MITAITIYLVDVAFVYLVGVALVFAMSIWSGEDPYGDPMLPWESLRMALVWPLIILVAAIAYFSKDDDDDAG